MLVPQVTDLVEYRDYDAGGHLIAAHHADGGVDRYRYNAFGDKIAWTDARGATTAYTYDKLGRLIQTASSAAIATYAIQNGALAATGAKTLIERIGYDELGRTLNTTNGAGETTFYRYDLRGNVIGVRKPGLSVELRSVYDARDRKIFEADGNGQAASWRYDYFGQLLAHTDLGGAVYTYRYDHAGQRLRQYNTRGQNLHYHYDAAGQLIRLYDSAVGKLTDYAYDRAGQRVREHMAQLGVTYQNNLLAYDALGRLRHVSDGYLSQTLDYDAHGNRTRVQTRYLDASNTARNHDDWYGYDAMNRQTTVEAVNANLEINATQGHKLMYDANGNRLSDTYWDQVISASGSTAAGLTTETYTYDLLNRLSTRRRDGQLLDARYYDGADRVVQSGIDGSQSQAFFERSGLSGQQQRNTYDSAGQLRQAQSLGMSARGLTVRSETTYLAYDDAGNVTQYRLDSHEGSRYSNTYTYS